MTPQVPEQLLHRGRRLKMCADPLDAYFARLPKARRPHFLSTSSCCHRGYVGTWEIRDGRLLLVALEGLLEREGRAVEADLGMALPWLLGPLHARWLTDELRCPEGRLLQYAHMSAYGSLYERDRLFWVEKGQLKGEYLRLNPPEPVVYRIAEDGTRGLYGSDGWKEIRLPDPLAEDDEPQGWKLWGRPPEGEEDYVIGAWCTYPPQLSQPGADG